MSSLLLNILFVSVGAAVGTLGGWFLRGGSAQSPDDKPPSADKEPVKSIAHMETLMGRLHQLTSSVAADIGEHNSRVREINHELVNGADVVSIVERLVEANEKMQSQLQSAEKRLQSQAKEIESHVKEARTDALTRLANRRAFDDEIRHCVESQRTTGVPFCVMMVDVDHFKRFNDTYGHQAGDEVLKGVARVLRREFAGREVVCRYGGEEFAIIFPGVPLDAVIHRAEQGRAAIAGELFEYDDMDLKVTASAGIAESAPEETGQLLVRRADDALYMSKSNGRNCGHWHDGDTSLPIKAYAGRKLKPVPPVPVRADPIEPAVRTIASVFQLSPPEEGSPSERRDRIPGLSDRDTVCKDLERRLTEQQRRGTPASLVLIEVDNFADITRDYGEKAADLALRAAAQVVKVSKRDMDHAARFDAVVFAVLVPGTDMPDGLVVAERMRSAAADCIVPACGEQLQFTVSIGVTSTRRGDDVATVVSRASQALQDAKTSGGNHVCSVAADEVLSRT